MASALSSQLLRQFPAVKDTYFLVGGDKMKFTRGEIFSLKLPEISIASSHCLSSCGNVTCGTCSQLLVADTELPTEPYALFLPLPVFFGRPSGEPSCQNCTLSISSVHRCPLYRRCMYESCYGQCRCDDDAAKQVPVANTYTELLVTSTCEARKKSGTHDKYPRFFDLRMLLVRRHP